MPSPRERHLRLAGPPPRPQFWGSQWGRRDCLRFPQNWALWGLCLLLLTASPHGARAASPAPPARASAPLPDYGGRDAPVVPADAGAEAASPLAQAGRTLGSLVVVLGAVVGVVFLLKRAGFTSGGPVALIGGAFRQPAPPASVAAMVVTQSQPLPGGGALHLVSVRERTLLLGVTAQGVAVLAEWEEEAPRPGSDEARAEDAAFTDYLARAGIPPSPDRAAARAAGERVAGAATRLQDLLARAPSPDEMRP